METGKGHLQAGQGQGGKAKSRTGPSSNRTASTGKNRGRQMRPQVPRQGGRVLYALSTAQQASRVRSKHPEADVDTCAIVGRQDHSSSSRRTSSASSRCGRRQTRFPSSCLQATSAASRRAAHQSHGQSEVAHGASDRSRCGVARTRPCEAGRTATAMPTKKLLKRICLAASRAAPIIRHHPIGAVVLANANPHPVRPPALVPFV